MGHEHLAKCHRHVATMLRQVVKLGEAVYMEILPPKGSEILWTSCDMTLDYLKSLSKAILKASAKDKRFEPIAKDHWDKVIYPREGLQEVFKRGLRSVIGVHDRIASRHEKLANRRSIDNVIDL